MIAWLLENGPAGAENFSPSLESITARSNCDCGCPSIEFSVPSDVPPVDYRGSMMADFTGVADGYSVGLMLVAGFGVLSELEVYIFGECNGIFGLPAIENLRPCPVSAQDPAE
jgi:hypothetical protein